MGEYINKLWYIHTMGHHSAIKINKPLICTTACVNHASIITSERRQTEMLTVNMVHYFNVLEKAKLKAQ